MIRAGVVMCLAAMLWTGPAAGFGSDEPLADPAQELRARELAKGFRCLVCQNQSIFDSDAELAVDLRRIVRERIHAGDSDAEVTDYLVARYGDFVLLKPPLNPKTYLLWFGPAVIALIGLGAVVVFIRRTRVATAPAPLNEAERARLDALLDDNRDT